MGWQVHVHVFDLSHLSQYSILLHRLHNIIICVATTTESYVSSISTWSQWNPTLLSPGQQLASAQWLLLSPSASGQQASASPPPPPVPSQQQSSNVYLPPPLRVITPPHDGQSDKNY